MRILAIDIETRPLLAYTWGVYNINIGVDQIVNAGGMMCFAAKWVGEDGEVEFRSDHHDGHKTMVKRAHRLLNQADAVLHYNGKRFDVPHIQREFAELGLLPPAPFKQIDLLHTVKRQFRFPMNKLAFVAPQLGLDDKVKHEGFGLWIKCIAGDEDAWERMRVYNIQDTILLEDAYYVLQPWIKAHPNVAAFTGEHACPKCGGTNLAKRGLARTQVNTFQRYRCRDCGSWSRSNRREYGTTVVPVAD